MKHAFWDRLLIVLCALLLLGLSVALLGIVIGFLPFGSLMEQVTLLAAGRFWRVTLCVLAAALAAMAVFVFWIILPPRKGRFSTFALQQTEHGALKISVKALENLVQKCTSQHPELAIVSSAIYSNETTVRVELRVTLQSDINIPLAVASLQKQIKQYVEACSGVDVEAVFVTVEATVPPAPGDDSPYAIPETLQPQLPKNPVENPPLAPPEPPVEPAAPAAESLPMDLPEDEDTSWMEAKPAELSEGPGLGTYPPPEPMPDWLLEREPGRQDRPDERLSEDADGEDDETAEGAARDDAQKEE